MRIIFKLFSIVAFFLLGIALVRISLGSEPVYSFALLEYLSEAPTLIPNSFTPVFEITGQWAFLDGLRIFLNGLGTILGYIGYFAKEAVNLLGYVFYFFKFLFV